MKPTNLERDILNWIAARSGNSAIKVQLSDVEIAHREHTGKGILSYLRVLSSSPTVEYQTAPVNPAIESPDLDCGGGCVLFFEKGHANCLEIYAFGDTFPDELSSYELIDSNKTPTK